jgi:hypothetical protein
VEENEITMLYLVLLVTVCACWLALRIQKKLSKMNTALSQRLDQLEQCQQKTFDLICDAVDEFGEIKEGNTERERLSQRLLAGRRALNKFYEDVANPPKS